MRKKLIVLLSAVILVILCVIGLSACTGKNFTVKYSATAGGYVLGNCEQIVKSGEDGNQVIAIANDGYAFVKWSDGITENVRRDENVTENLSITAEFVKTYSISYNVKYFIGKGGYISGCAEQTVPQNEDAKAVTAVPNTGYRFVKWSDGVETAKRTDTNIIEDKSLTAEFQFLFSGGEGTEESPFLIENYEEFLNTSFYPYSFYKLTQDLDLSGKLHEPVFDKASEFEGYFDGNNKTIKNITIETDKNYPSVFGFIGVHGIIKNLKLENVNITAVDFDTESTWYCVGILAGVSNGLLQNIDVSGSIAIDGLYHSRVAVGGLVGAIKIGAVQNCNADVTMQVKDAKTENGERAFCFGGLTGVNSSANISYCTVNGTITVEQSASGLNIAGLIGYWQPDYNENVQTSVMGCQTNVNISGDGYNAGGLVGEIYVSANSLMCIKNSSAHGDIVGSTVGGLICSSHGTGELWIENCYADNNVTGFSRAAGFVMQLSCKTYLKGCYVTGNIITHSRNDEGTVAGMAAGFVYQASKSEFKNCYVKASVSSTRACGFGLMIMSGCMLDGCFAEGSITATLTGGAFIIYCGSNLNILNCYSLCTLISSGENTVFYALASGLRDSNVQNYYYAGNAADYVIGSITDTTVEKCYVYVSSGLSAVIREDHSTQELPVEITVCESLEDLYNMVNDKEYYG